MMQWIDSHAVLLQALLWMAALGGFFVYQRRPHAPGSMPAPVPSARAAGGWLALSLVAALALAAMAAHVQAGLMAAAGAPSTVGPAPAPWIDWLALDQGVERWVQTQGDAAWLPAVRALTQLGHVGWMALLGLLTCTWLLRRRAWLLAGVWALGVAGVGLWIRILKLAIGRARPEVRWAVEHGYSFPSGHSAGTLVCYGLLVWVVVRLLRPAHPHAWAALAVLVVLAVGGSRILLGVHYVSDVVAGWLLGLAWLACVLGLEALAQRWLARTARH